VIYDGLGISLGESSMSEPFPLVSVQSDKSLSLCTTVMAGGTWAQPVATTPWNPTLEVEGINHEWGHISASA